MLLKAGIIMMTLALAFAAGVAVYALLDEPMERAIASKPAAKRSLEPLVRSSPLAEPQVERAAAPPETEPEPQPEAKAEPKPEPEPERQVLLGARENWPMPTDEQVETASRSRHYDAPPGAIMGLTIESLGIYNAPVFSSTSQWALDNGIAHVPETSLPWSNPPRGTSTSPGTASDGPGAGATSYSTTWPSWLGG